MAGSGIEAVVDELTDHRLRALNHLSGRDLSGYGIIENSDPRTRFLHRGEV